MNKVQEAILAITKQILLTYPSLRVGQLMMSMTQGGAKEDVYYVSDEELLRRLQQYQQSLHCSYEPVQRKSYTTSGDE